MISISQRLPYSPKNKTSARYHLLINRSIQGTFFQGNIFLSIEQLRFYKRVNEEYRRQLTRSLINF